MAQSGGIEISEGHQKRNHQHGKRKPGEINESEMAA